MKHKPSNLCRRRCCHNEAAVRSRVDGLRICLCCYGKERDWSKINRNRVRDYKAEYQQRKAKNAS